MGQHSLVIQLPKNPEEPFLRGLEFSMPHTSNIALIGYRGVGKTSVARLLATRLGLDWVDADVEIELLAGKSISAIFSESGEPFFRELETQVVSELCQRERTVLALGGGAVLDDANCRCLADCQAIVWLRASADTIARRISEDSTSAGRRPNLTNHGGRTEIELLLDEREPIYRACATLVVDTEGKSPAEVADEIVASLGPGCSG